MLESKFTIQDILRSGRKFLLEPEAKSLCAYYGIDVPRFAIAKSFEDALRIANELGYPVVLKVISPDIIHKSDVGGVILNVSNDEELKESYERLMNNIRRNAPNARILGVLVEEQLPEGIEVIVGVTKDPQFGHVIMFGLGGIFVEVLNDVTFRILPIDREDALEMLHEIRGYPILEGYRGAKRADVNAIVGIMLKVSKLVMENPSIKEMDLNPIRVYEKGAKVLDVRILLN